MTNDPNYKVERPEDSAEAPDEVPAPQAQPVPTTDQAILRAMLGKPICVLGAEPIQRRKAG